MCQLDQHLLAAHAAGDNVALVKLYAQAADEAQNIDAACFYLTHAYVFALEQNHPDCALLRQRLIDHGREE